MRVPRRCYRYSKREGYVRRLERRRSPPLAQLGGTSTTRSAHTGPFRPVLSGVAPILDYVPITIHCFFIIESINYGEDRRLKIRIVRFRKFWKNS